MTTNLFSFSLLIFSLTLLFLTILYSEKLYKIDRHENEIMSININFASRLSRSTPRWYQVVARKMNRKKIKIGLLHVANGSFSEKMVYEEEVEVVNILFEPVSKEVKWNDLFPEWVDETLPWDSTRCPYIPMPQFDKYDDLDVVVANVPCGEGRRGRGRNYDDVLRLQVNLMVANLLVRSGRKNVNGIDDHKVFAVFGGSCGPMWEIFRCDDLLWHEGKSWVYRPDLGKLKQKVLMPVGSCQLAPPIAEPGQDGRDKAKEAYVSVLHSSEDYVCGAIALAQSIIRSNSTKDLILLVDDSISTKSLQGLKAAGWKIKHITRIRSPHARSETYNEWNYSKLRIWQLTEYSKLIFIDSDFIVLRNTDEFFIYPQLSAAGNSRYVFNSGFMLVEPSNCTFETLMRQRIKVASYNGGDQGFLNEMFMWWHRWPTKLNFLKDFNLLPNYSMHELIPQDVYALHYLGFKPWMCRQDQDYDCNWDVPENKRFASDSAHRIWRQVYNSMPSILRVHCVLTPEMEARKRMHIATMDFNGRFGRKFVDNL
ncbi:putative UDP-glucuronate:xylan alpha-glucuronosyltransferase 5 [Sesamum indicum]|uniref:Hexosyltransferase n=1 Tax=Sesamum indicum TaxID=4182 RepID=A0A8M8V0C2_SESIN|nr:putative UDP-glucuronate:xylan alpha-glucuronosyltransferase 5 [Sesamum indicum]